MGPKTVSPTPVMSGYCPQGYIGLGETGTTKFLRLTLLAKLSVAENYLSLVFIHCLMSPESVPFFEGNKCYKVVPGNEDALTWDEALNECRSASGIRPDLASIIDQYQKCKYSLYLINTQYFNSYFKI